MNIALQDIDGHNFPNLALMKLSAYHKKQGDSVSWYNPFDKFAILYKSKVFTFTQDDKYYKHNVYDKIKHGGSAYNYLSLMDEIEHIYPDYSMYGIQDTAYGFLTRGCPNKCSWCIVPSKEGSIRPHADVEEFWDGQSKAILLDNNPLASDYGLKKIEKIIRLGIKIDFNQGLDARIIANNPDVAKLLSRVKWHKPLRMACDHKGQMEPIKKATELLRKYGTTPRSYFVYVLVKDINDALERVEFLRKLKLDPFAQPYIDFSGKNKVTKEQKQFARWVNHKAIFKSVEFKNYKK